MTTPAMLRAAATERTILARRTRATSASPLHRALRASAVALAVLPAVSCLRHDRPDSGKPPEGQIRVAEPNDVRARREAAKRAGKDPDKPVPAESVIAVTKTGIYHREGCTVLEEAPAETRVPFTTPWLALDEGHTPCSHCRPGP